MGEWFDLQIKDHIHNNVIWAMLSTIYLLYHGGSL